MTEIVVIDERHAPLTAKNTEAGEGSLAAANNADVVVVISNDGMFVQKGVGRVALITPKSANAMSREKADEESAKFEREHRGSELEQDSQAALVKGVSVWPGNPDQNISNAQWRVERDQEEEACGQIMIGSGDDTYDPTCDLGEGHPPPCKSRSAIDQHRLD